MAMHSSATLRIKLDDSSKVPELIVDRKAVSFWSSCADGLPDNAAEWDLSQLLIEGKAVERSIVVAWLNAVWKITHWKPFEQQEQNPAGTMSGLAQLLAFADAVGSRTGLVMACLHAPALDVLCWDLHPPGAATLLLPVDTPLYWSSLAPHMVFSPPSPASGSAKALFTQQLTAAAESLMYLAYKLQLPALQEKMQAVIKANVRATESVLYGALGGVMSDRVVDSIMAGSPGLAKQLLINNMVSERGGFIAHLHAEQLFKPVLPADQLPAPIKVTVELMRDCFGHRKGAQVPVIVNLFQTDEPNCTINGTAQVLQLLMGPLIKDAVSKDALMGQS